MHYFPQHHIMAEVRSGSVATSFNFDLQDQTTRIWISDLIRTDMFRKFQIPRDQIYANGFPVCIITKTEIPPNEYQKNRKMFVEENDQSRVCTRCQKTFMVEKSGFQKRSDKIICQSTYGNNPFHVHDQQPISVLQEFQTTSRVDENNQIFSGTVYALDVEMVYTSHGQALGRVTMVDLFGDVVVDSIVKPDNEIYDPVTKYSGLKLEDFEDAKYNWITVRDSILSHMNQESILIGHGLYGDLKALKIIHYKVIDTSILFNRNGNRPCLRVLASKYLKRIIQNGDGHCSKEDAIAALELVYFAALNPHVLT